LDEQFDPLNAVTRFLESSSEEYLRESAAIQEAARNSPPPEMSCRYSPYAQASRAASFRSTKGSARSVISAQSSKSSAGSSASAASRTSRKGRRKYPIPPLPKTPSRPTTPATPLTSSMPSVPLPKLPDPFEKDEQSPIPRPFACTFSCGKQFAKEFEWKRHESSIHVPQDEWTCNRTGAHYLPEHCPYDLSSFPSSEHLDGHRHYYCLLKAEESRTFQRKDHLLQHLKIVHRIKDVSIMKDVIASWRSPTKPLPDCDPVLNCGFCGTHLSDWQSRISHVASHFRDGKTISAWWMGRLDCTLNFSAMFEISQM
jgi:hypothetical protein